VKHFPEAEKENNNPTEPAGFAGSEGKYLNLKYSITDCFLLKTRDESFIIPLQYVKKTVFAFITGINDCKNRYAKITIPMKETEKAGRKILTNHCSERFTLDD